MVAEPRVWVDVEGAVRAWARAAVSSVDGRVFFGWNEDAAHPQVSLSRVAGPDDRCLVQFDVWAAKSQGKAQAASTAAELCTAADALSRYEHEGVLLHGARVLGSRWQPDFESGAPRYIVEVVFFATATVGVEG